QSQEQFRTLLQASQQAQVEPGKRGGLNVDGRRRALEELRDFVADKLFRLNQALEEEKKRREAVEKQLAENSRRRAELEAALREIQGYQQSIQSELENAADPRQLAELQGALAESQHARERLQRELDDTRHELRTLQSSRASRASEFAERARELQADQAEVEEKVQSLNDALIVETERRQRAEQQAIETARRQRALETELIDVRNTQ